MRAFWTVLTAELYRRRTAFWIAAALGLALFLVPLVYGGSPEEGRDAQAATAMVLALIFSFSLALLLGSSSLAGDLLEGRFNFWLSQPVPLMTFWSGRSSAAMAIAAGAGALLLLPTAIVAGGHTSLEFSGLVEMTLFLAPLAALAHVLTIALRDRSVWSLLTLGGTFFALAVGTFGWLFSGGLTRGDGLGGDAAAIPPSIFGWFAWVCGGIWVLGSALQVLRGRTQVRLGHRAMAITLFCLLVPLSAWQLYRLHHPPVPSLHELAAVYEVSASRDGRWFTVSGKADDGTGHTFLADTRGGNPISLGTRVSIPPVFSRDGSTAVWLQKARDSSELYVANLGDETPIPTLVAHFRNGRPRALALSPAGQRVAFFGSQYLEILDIPRQRFLGPYPAFSTDNLRLFFVGEEHLRLYSGPTKRYRPVEGIEIYDLDLQKRVLQRTGVVEGVLEASHLEPEANGHRLLAREPGNTGQISLRDGGTGELIRIIDPAPPTSLEQAIFLRGGGMAFLGRDSDGTDHLRVLDGAGEPLASIPLEGSGHTSIVAETGNGSILLTRLLVNELTDVGWGSRSLEEANLVSGEVQTVARNLYFPGAFELAGESLVWDARFLPNAAASLVLQEAFQKLLLLDRSTGETLTLAGHDREAKDL